MVIAGTPAEVADHFNTFSIMDQSDFIAHLTTLPYDYN